MRLVTTGRRLPLVLIAVLMLLTAAIAPLASSAQSRSSFVPIGGGYTTASLQGFAEIVIDNAPSRRNPVIDIAVVPSTYGTSLEDREENIELAGERAQQIEDACESVLAGSRFESCEAELLMLFDRDQAEDPINSEPLLNSSLDGVFILGGDQTIAMDVLANTIAEERMAEAFNRGVTFGGTSAGAAMQSQTMLAGYTDSGWPYNALERDQIIIWWADNAGHERGLSFGLEGILTDQHFYERGRLTRLLNAVAQSDERFGGDSLLGVGVDWGTGVEIARESRISGVFGESSIFVIDAESQGTNFEWVGPQQTLSAGNILTHVIAPGDAGYDVESRMPTLAGNQVEMPRLRGSTSLAPRTSVNGTLILGGDLSVDWTGGVIEEFIARADRQQGTNIAIVVAGVTDPAVGQDIGQEYADKLSEIGWQGAGRSTSVVVYDDTTTSADIFGSSNRRGSNTAGVILVGGDQALIAQDLATGLHNLVLEVLSRSPVTLTDRAMTAFMGDWAVANPDPTDGNYQDEGIFAFRSDYADFVPGLGVVRGAAIEPVLTWDQRWGRLYGIAEQHPETLVYGISENTAILIEGGSATVLGERSVVALDARRATFQTGTNGAFTALNVFLHLFAPGEVVR